MADIPVPRSEESKPLLPPASERLQQLQCTSNKTELRHWRRPVDGHKETFFISTDRELVDKSFVQQGFQNPAMPWATPLLDEHMDKMLDNSCTLGLYLDQERKPPRKSREMVGMARMITDYVTFAYLTDVYIEESHRGKGLGKWLIQCCGEFVEHIPNLRWMTLLTSSEPASKMYQQTLGMLLMGKMESGLMTMGSRKEHLKSAKSAWASDRDNAPEDPNAAIST